MAYSPTVQSAVVSAFGSSFGPSGIVFTPENLGIYIDGELLHIDGEILCFTG